MFTPSSCCLSFVPCVPVEVLGSPVKNHMYDFVAFDSDEEGEGEASVLTIPNLRASDDPLHPPGNPGYCQLKK